MRFPALAAACLLSLPVAQAALAQAEGERLLIAPPPGWQATQPAVQGKMVITRLYPPGQGPESWNEAISVQRLDDRSAKPKEFVQGLVQKSRDSCEGAQVGNLEEAPINGYAAASVRLACTKGKQSGKGGLMLVTAIRGQDALFVVQRMWMGPPVRPNEVMPVPGKVIEDFNAFARGITVCDSRQPSHPCPR